MVKKYNLLKLLLLISILTNASFLYAEQEQKSSQPVWAGMKSEDNLPVENTNNDFVKPAPIKENNKEQKLIAKIIPTNLAVDKGELVTFTIESNESDLRYYWISDGIKNTKSSFAIKTEGLKLGKHRVRVTVTNKKRKQAHASAYFMVKNMVGSSSGEEPTKNSLSNNTVDSNSNALKDGTVQPMELPAISVESTPQPSRAKSSESKEVIELPISAIKKDGEKANPLTILPAQATVGSNETVLFKSNVSKAEGYQFDWKFAGKHSNSETFEILSGDLEPGSYQVHLVATNEDSKIIRAQATLHIRSNKPIYILVPNLMDANLTEAKQQLKDQGLVLGRVSKLSIKNGKGTVIEQSPSLESRVAIGSIVHIVIGISTTVKVPNLLKLNKTDVDNKLADSDLLIGRILTKINDKAIGLVIDQDPKANTRFQRGSKVNLIFGKASPKPLTAIIQPSSTITEAGRQIELTAVIVDPEVDNDLNFSWTLGELKSTNRIFKIDSSKLLVGIYRVKLVVKDTDNREISATSKVEIIAKTIPVPNLTGKSLEQARLLIEKEGLVVGEIQRQMGNVEKETVIKQTPLFGEQVIEGSQVQIIVEIPKPEEKSVLQLEADVNELKAGESVTFKLELTPKPESDKVHYVYTINNEKKANVKSTFQWTPEIEGIYTMTVAAFSDKGLLAKSSALMMTVKPGWEMPVAKIIPEIMVVQQGDSAEFVSTSTYDLNTRLSYEWTSDTGHSSAKKQFSFDTREVVPGSYSVKLVVTDTNGNQSINSTILVVQVGGHQSSKKQLVDNLSQPNSMTKVINPDVKISTSKRFIGTGTPIKFSIMTDIPLAPAYYYFETGDDKNTEWLHVAEVEHRYDSFGAYRVQAAVKKGDKFYYSDSTTVWVFSPLLFMVMGGLASLVYGLIWWWTKGIPSTVNKKNTIAIKSDFKPIVEELDIRSLKAPLQEGTDHGIVTEMRSEPVMVESPEPIEKNQTVTSVLIKGLFQFIMGIAISILIIYLILKSMSLL